MELYDGIPVTSYQGRFSGSFEVDGRNNDLVKLGKVCVWVVVARSGESQTKEVADGEEAQRKVVQKVEAAIPLEGDLRDEAIVWLSHDGERGSIGFARENTPAERQLEKLRLYLEEFHGDSLKGEGEETVMDATMRLLDRLASGVPVERDLEDMDDNERPGYEVPDSLTPALDPETGEITFTDKDWDEPVIKEPAVTATIHDRRYGTDDDGDEVTASDTMKVVHHLEDDEEPELRPERVGSIHDRRF